MRLAATVLALWPLAAAGGIVGADYTQPTPRYDHGVLGDAIEWGALDLRLDDGRRLRVTLPETRVFEDIAPRLADVDGDGDAEVIVVETDVTRGAQLAIYDETGKIASTPHIGQRNRWLAPVAAADLDGDGRVEIAYVDRPHLARILRVWRLDAGRLREVARLEGVTNHRIGDDFISGGLRDCPGEAPHMVVASPDWRRIVVVRLDGGRLVARDAGPLSAHRDFSAALSCR